MHGRSADTIIVDDVSGLSNRVYKRSKDTLRTTLERRPNGTWVLRRFTVGGPDVFVRTEMGFMRTKDALKVLDAAWRMFKMEHAREKG